MEVIKIIHFWFGLTCSFFKWLDMMTCVSVSLLFVLPDLRTEQTCEFQGGWRSEVDWDWCISLRDECVGRWLVWRLRWCFHTATRRDGVWWHYMLYNVTSSTGIPQNSHWHNDSTAAKYLTLQTSVIHRAVAHHRVAGFRSGSILIMIIYSNVWFIQYVDSCYVWLNMSSLLQSY